MSVLLSSVALLLAVSVLAVFPTGCRNEDDPNYWLGKMQDPIWRDQALTNLERLFSKTMRENEQSIWSQPVREYVDVVGRELIGLYPGLTMAGTEDVTSKNTIVQLLSQMESDAARPVYEAALADIQGTRIVRANTAAEALARFCRSGEPQAEFIPPPTKRDERWRQRCTEGAQSADQLLQVVQAVKARRAERGSNAENTAEEDQLTRSAVSALGNIVLGNLEHPRRAEIVSTLAAILETPDTVQDLAVNMQALNMIGEIGDAAAIPTLVRALFIQGQRRQVALQEVVRPAMLKMGDLNQMASAMVKAGRMQDKALNDMQQRDPNFDVRLIKEQIAITLGLLGVQTPEVIQYLTEELELAAPSDFDRTPPRGGAPFTPEISMAHRRSFAAQAMGKIRHEPALPTIISRLRMAKVGEGYEPEDKVVNMLEIPGYVDALGDYLMPEKTNSLLMPFVLYGDDALIDRAGRRLYLQAGPEVAAQMEERANQLEECEEGMRGCPRDNYLKIYVPIIRSAEGCTTVECWAGRLSDESGNVKVRAAYSLARLAHGDMAKGKAARDAMLRAAKSESSEDVIRAYVFAIERLSPNGCDEACLTMVADAIDEMRVRGRNAQRRDLTRLHGFLAFRAKSGGR